MSEKVLQALRALGLTEYEARAFLALVEHGEMDAQSLSHLSKVPYSKIYGVLESLRRRGWVSVRRGRPKIYYARAPVDVIKIERARVEEELKEVEAVLVEELQPIYERSRARERPDVWIIRGIEAVLDKAREMLANARSEVLLALPTAAKSLLPLLSPSLKHLRFLGVRISILASEELREELSELEGLAEVRYRSGMFGGGLIVDGREALLVLSEPGARELMAIWSDYAELAHIAKVYFEHLWRGDPNAPASHMGACGLA